VGVLYHDYRGARDKSEQERSWGSGITIKRGFSMTPGKRLMNDDILLPNHGLWGVDRTTGGEPGGLAPRREGRRGSDEAAATSYASMGDPALMGRNFRGEERLTHGRRLGGNYKDWAMGIVLHTVHGILLSESTSILAGTRFHARPDSLSPFRVSLFFFVLQQALWSAPRSLDVAPDGKRPAYLCTARGNQPRRRWRRRESNVP